MYNYLRLITISLSMLFLYPAEPLFSKPLPEAILKIMEQPRYKHSTWGLLLKNAKTGEVIYSHNADKMLLPSSVTKLFPTATLLQTFGKDYRIETPVYAVGSQDEEGHLQGDLVLVAKGDLFMGGRVKKDGTISFTDLDHTTAVTGLLTELTPEDPLSGLKELAEQVYNSGIRSIDGNVVIDDRMFKPIKFLHEYVTPLMINDNLIDFVIEPTSVGQTASLMWRPQIPEYKVINNVKTVKAGQKSEVTISPDSTGKQLTIEGTIALDTEKIVNIFPIDNPTEFGRLAFIEALRSAGVEVKNHSAKDLDLPSQEEYSNLKPVATLVSPALSEYIKLVLKVSLNLGANLSPLLISSAHGEADFDKGMKAIGDFVTQKVGIEQDSISLSEAAGAIENRFTPTAVTDLLSYMASLPEEDFKAYRDALPILGVDGSMGPYEKDSAARGHVYGKTGTGIAIDFTKKYPHFYLLNQSLAGYIEAQNGDTLVFAIIANNVVINDMQGVLKVFADEGKISSILYDSYK